jgi:hypothetical protein
MNPAEEAIRKWRDNISSGDIMNKGLCLADYVKLINNKREAVISYEDLGHEMKGGICTRCGMEVKYYNGYYRILYNGEIYFRRIGIDISLSKIYVRGRWLQVIKGTDDIFRTLHCDNILVGDILE